MLSHSLEGGDWGMAEHGQASPIDIPSNWVREDGQIDERPSISTVHKVDRGMMGTDEAMVEGCEMR